MTSYESKGVKPEYGAMHGFDHAHWWVGNAMQAASWFCARMGFEPFAYKGLETGDRQLCTHVVRQGKIFFAFSSALNPPGAQELVLGDDPNAHVAKHGDGVKDIAFTVEDCRAVYDAAMKRGAVSVTPPTELTDEEGTVIMATVKTYGETVHSFVQRDAYTGGFLPGYKLVTRVDPLVTITPSPGLRQIDHCVGNMPDGGMLATVEYYENVLQFHRFWSVDDTQMHTEFSALRSTVMADWDEGIKMPINEPAPALRKSQIQEFVEYYGGEGVQHIALETPDIINAITQMNARGVQFLTVPAKYYVSLRERLARSDVEVKEDLAKIEELNILVDFDERGYLLQLFTLPLMDRPTVFLEIIQREGNTGFGAGNFKALFESIERAQEARGNLVAEVGGVAASGAGGVEVKADA